jgi:aryl-alcohol dehydrogenase-like predicted oxidoreductase
VQLALGTVQFGLAYGIAGRGEAVPDHEVRTILEDASARGVRTIDTAADYGDIESRLSRLAAGLPLEVVSKVPAIPQELSPYDAAAFALRMAQRSRDRLGPLLRGLMVHRSTDLLGERGDAVWPALTAWAQADGIRLGASCYDPADADALARQRGIALTQVPGNAFDQRIAHSEAHAPLRQVEVHLRSAFLQGLLLIPLGDAKRRLPVAATALDRWHADCARRGAPPLQSALSVVQSFSLVSKVVVGVDRLAQWTEIAEAWDEARPIHAPDLACQQAEVTDPRLWSTHS